MRFVKIILLYFILTLSSLSAQKQTAQLNNSALSDPTVDLKKVTTETIKKIVAGTMVAVTLQSTNTLIGTYTVDNQGYITFNFPTGITDPGSGIFVFDIGAGQNWNNPLVTGVNGQLTTPFTATTPRPFVYKVIFKIGAQSKGAFAVSGKNES